MPVDPDAQEWLKKLTGNPEATFRGDQWSVIDSIVNRREKVLLVQRTGWGKSAVYFISARMLRDRGRGLTLIVSPLLGLMRNQVFAGKRMNLRIGALHSGTNDRFDTFVNLLGKDAIDVLLVSPERFANEQFRQQMLPLVADRLALLVIDEAHCISDWGHDFRPDYQRLRNVVQSLPPNSPLLATTATANDRVVEDVSNQLGNLRVSRGALIRENLALQTMPTMSAVDRLAWLAKNVPELPGKGIIYTLTKHDAQSVAAWLISHGVDAHAYYGDITTPAHPDSYDARIDLEDRFTNGDLRVLVATSALGMGYDNPEIRFVIHYQTPGSIIAYYQQVGRAGRARETAVGVLMSGPEDSQIHESFRTQSLPAAEEVSSILAALEQGDGLTAMQLQGSVNMPKGRLAHALKYLSVRNPAPIAQDGRMWRRNAVTFDKEYARHRQDLIAVRELEWKEISDYRRADTGCQMNILLRALDDPSPVEQCGNCENCTGTPIVPVELDPVTSRLAADFLDRPVVTPIVPRRQLPKGASTLFRNTRIPLEGQAEIGCVLSSWHDTEGISQLVKTGKHAGQFDDRVVTAAVQMIDTLWKPEPRPAWVTFVPSLRHPALVSDFARRLADRLGLPCVPVVGKTRETEPQKLQANSFHQCHNLDGAFVVSSPLPAGPVLLVDDLVDSGWTMTMIAALLRQAESGPVFPFALATTAKRNT
jgi:ATP-dependent DNA helicase RecQ